MSPLVDLRGKVLVVGGGPAGLAAAIALRLRGFAVVVADAARPPIDKACGEGILPSGVDALRQLGVPLGVDDGFPFRGVRMMDGDVSAEALFPAACGVAIRRTRLHGLLTERAIEVGVQLCWGERVALPLASSQCLWLVGADGQQSHVRRDAGLEGNGRGFSRYGFRRHYHLAPWTDMVEVYWGARGQVYVTPVAADEIGVALLTRDSHLRLDEALLEFPGLARRLRAATASSSERGGCTVTRRFRSVFQDRTILAGDASGSVDAITGEGLSLSFLQALSLAEACTSGDLRGYQATHRHLARRPTALAHMMLFLERVPRLRRSLWRGLTMQPSLYRLALPKHALTPSK